MSPAHRKGQKPVTGNSDEFSAQDADIDGRNRHWPTALSAVVSTVTGRGIGDTRGQQGLRQIAAGTGKSLYNALAGSFAEFIEETWWLK